MIEPNNIYLGNAYELIKQVPDKSIDLIYTDIPYEMSFNKETLVRNDGSMQSKCRANMKKDLDPIVSGIDYSIFSDLLRVCKTPNIYVWCSFPQVFKIKEACDKTIPNLTYKMMVWHKTNALLMNYGQWVPDLEYCLVITKGAGIPNTEKLRPSKLFECGVNSNENKDFGHPTVKPLKMVCDHIRIATKPGDLVLDPFSGSGTTAQACKTYDRNFIAFEIDAKYHEQSLNRLKGITVGQSKSGFVQGSLFNF